MALQNPLRKSADRSPHLAQETPSGPGLFAVARNPGGEQAPEPRLPQSGDLAPGYRRPPQRTTIPVAGQADQFEQALRETEARLSAVFNAAVDAILTLDAEGRIESVNPAAEAIFGYAADELVGRNIRVLVHGEEEYATYLGEYLKAGLKRRIGRRRELRGCRSDGSSFPMEMSISETSLGDRRLFAIIARDMTQEKLLERRVLEMAVHDQQRIGYDLHDGLGQELTGLASLASVLQGELSRKRGCLTEAAEAGEIVRLANRSIAHARALVRGLCPVRLDADGLMLALADLAEDIEQVHGCVCVFRCPEPVLVRDHQVASHLYSIALEAITHAARQAARRIEVGLRTDGGRGLLTVEDDGARSAGADGEEGPRLHIMRYRARLIGGSLYVRPRDGGGTTVACTFENKPSSSSQQRTNDYDHRNQFYACTADGDAQARGPAHGLEGEHQGRQHSSGG